MTNHPPFVSVTNTLIRVNATAVTEMLPDNVTPETHLMSTDLDTNCELLEIGFIERSHNSKRNGYAMAARSGGYHTNSGGVRDTILEQRGVGRYACEWNSKDDCLVVDLTTEVMEPYSQFEIDYPE